MKFIKYSLLCSLVITSFLQPVLAQVNLQKKADSLLKLMTLTEKVNMIHAVSGFTSGGVKRLGVPELAMTDGPHGIRIDYVESTYFPTGVCLAATWNPALGIDYGAALGKEAAFQHKDVLLGPGINIIRSPLNGRNFEYMSEDPYLISRMVVGYIKGVQAQDISACVKHFAANNQETHRQTINVEMSERALQELYLPGFKAAVTEGHVNAVMGAYNKFRGEWASHNNYLLNQVLKKDWGFNGVVISDWAAVHSTTQAIWNGCDIEMGTNVGKNWGRSFMGDTVVAMVKSGKIPEYLIDDKVRRILNLMLKTKMIGQRRPAGVANTAAQQQTAAKVAIEGIVLLKNEGQTLPLKKETRSIAVIGAIADRKLANGGGSSGVRAKYEVTLLEGMKNIAEQSIKINYAAGYAVGSKLKNDSLIAQAVAVAKNSDAVIISAGYTHIFDNEGADKSDIEMPWGQNELIQAVIKANPKTTVVLMGGGALNISKWVNDVPAVIQGWYPGMEGGNVLAKIIMGQINPSGKLPFTFPKFLEDSPAFKLGQFPGDGTNVYYNDDIYVGYRYFDTFKVEPQYAFGHGLSYTTFSYQNLTVKGNVVTFSVTNTGKVAGQEVAQLYIKPINPSLPRPEKELKGFQKIYLQPNESKRLSFTLTADSFKFYNDVLHGWVSDKGVYGVVVGSSSRDLRLEGNVKL